jgi:hypothetical protein
MGTPYLEADSGIDRHEIRAIDSPLPPVIAHCPLGSRIVSRRATVVAWSLG